MQYAFAYMYFMMQEPKPFDLDEFWSILDTNKDGYSFSVHFIVDMCCLRLRTG